MSNEYKGTIKIKNADGILEPFLPATDVSCIDDANGTSLDQTLSDIETQISIAETSGGIELMYEEPDEENTADFSNETLIAYIPKYSWSFTINTQATTSKAKIGAVPLNLYGQNGVSLKVNWGDGKTSILTPEQYTASNSRASVHTYTAYGTYTIAVSAAVDDWKKIFLLAANENTTPDYTNDLSSPIYIWRNTLIGLNNAIPKVAGTAIINSNQLTYSSKKLDYLFLKCMQLTSIPDGLFDENTQTISFSYCFNNCTAITSIPEGLFDNNAKAADFSCCFYYCTAITSIPEGLFDNNPLAATFSDCFRSCSSLQSIPEGLFDNNPLAATFSYCFRNCTSLQSIPSGLFDKNTAVTDFQGCFYSCSSLQSIPEGVFDNNTAAIGFQYCFRFCTSLQSIPSGLFDKNTAATSFLGCFYGCSSIQSIPSGLFDKNTQATNFNSCFYGCSSLQSIPSGLFDKNTQATNFNSCFNSCNALNSFTLHISSSLVTSCTSFVTKKNGATRRIYVPSNSTTETSFNSVALSLGLVIVGE